MSFRNNIKRVVYPILKPFAKRYFSKPRKYTYKNINAVILPGIFHPQLTISTKLLLVFISELDLKEKTVLELGCGSGVNAVLAAQKGGLVTASDINPKAIENVEQNAASNNVEISAIQSDLFLQMPKEQFDLIIINPPYYPKAPETIEQKAWYCGEDFEYFEQLFAQIVPFISTSGRIIMILSEDCNIDHIQQIGAQNNFVFSVLQEKKVAAERNFIFEIKIKKEEPTY